MPINVVAHAGEQTRQQHKARAIDLFCTRYVPQAVAGVPSYSDQTKAINSWSTVDQAASALFDLQSAVVCLNRNSHSVFSALVAVSSRWFTHHACHDNRGGCNESTRSTYGSGVDSPYRRGLRTNLRNRQGQSPTAASGCYQRLVR